LQLEKLLSEVLHPEVDGSGLQTVQAQEGDDKHGDAQDVGQLLPLELQSAVPPHLLESPHAVEGPAKSHRQNRENGLQVVEDRLLNDQLTFLCA
jgi:hypothetical protein